jgi:hypothetical protein
MYCIFLQLPKLFFYQTSLLEYRCTIKNLICSKKLRPFTGTVSRDFEVCFQWFDTEIETSFAYSTKKYGDAQSPDWDSFHLQMLSRKNIFLAGGLPVPRYGAATETAQSLNSPDQLTEFADTRKLKNSTRKQNFKSQRTVRGRNFRSIEWHQKTYLNISYDYPFNPFVQTNFRIEFLECCVPVKCFVLCWGRNVQ